MQNSLDGWNYKCYGPSKETYAASARPVSTERRVESYLTLVQVMHLARCSAWRYCYTGSNHIGNSAPATAHSMRSFGYQL